MRTGRASAIRQELCRSTRPITNALNHERPNIVHLHQCLVPGLAIASCIVNKFDDFTEVYSAHGAGSDTVFTILFQANEAGQ